jgi:hypothetical protein
MINRLIAVLINQPLVDIQALSPELQEPLAPFIRRGIRYLRTDQVRRFYEQAGTLIEERTRLYDQQTAAIKAQTDYELATAMAEFVAGLSVEERGLLQMRFEVEARLEIDRLQAENAKLTGEVAYYRNLLPRSEMSAPDRNPHARRNSDAS